MLYILIFMTYVTVSNTAAANKSRWNCNDHLDGRRNEKADVSK